MANPEHVKILKKGIKKWNKWRRENDEIRPNLRSVILYKADLCSADLRYADLNYAVLRSSNLQSADLEEANLRSANLQLADLSNANLSFADLSDADLSSTNLNNANLSDAIIRNTDLSYADLSFADLRFAIIRSSNLISTDFSSARIGITTIDNIDLSSTKNLNSVIHDFPSGLTIRTLVRSKGEIPKIFLRSIGFNDWKITLRGLFRENLSPDELDKTIYKIHELKANEPIKIHPVFLSHSWKDKAFTRKLYDALQDRGVRCWLDEKQMKMGEKLIKGINKGINLYDKLVLICSKASLTSWWVEQELDLIFNKERKINEGKNEKDRYDLLIPIDLDGYIFDGWDGSWQTKIKNHVVGDFKGCMENEGKFKQRVEELVAALRVNPPDVAPQSFLPRG